MLSNKRSLHVVRESGFQNPGNFYLWNLESWAFRIRNAAQRISGIPLTIEIRNPSSTDKVRNPAPGIWNPLRGNQNPESKTLLHSLIWGERGHDWVNN